LLFKLFSRKKKIAAPADASVIAPAVESVENTRVARIAPAEIPVLTVVETAGPVETIATVDAASTEPLASAPAVTVAAPFAPAAPPKKPARSSAGTTAATKPATRAAATIPSKPAAKPLSKPVTTRSTAAQPTTRTSGAVTVATLRLQAKELGLSGYSRLTKSELLTLIAEHSNK
jgi:hypothetical protein